MKTLACEEDAMEIRQRIGSLRGAEERLWGSMSVGEMVCHVREAFRGALGDRTLTPGKFPLPRPVIKWIALRAPMRWPPNIETVRELKVGQPGLVPVDFARDRAGMLAEMERFRSTAVTQSHPIFGAMRTADWMRWGYLHTDHHLRQFGR